MWSGNIDFNITQNGRGTKRSPYQIKTAEQLAGLASIVNQGESFEGKYFELIYDIFLNTKEDWDNWTEHNIYPPLSWTPIGTTKHPFKGIFNGNYHTISYLYMHRNIPNRGLFGCIAEGAVIKNLNVSHFDICGTKNVGGLVGMACGKVVAPNQFINLLRKLLWWKYPKTLQEKHHVQGPIITQCCIEGYVTGDSFVGGLVGYAEEYPLLFQCAVNLCKINGKHYVGGVAGWTEGKVEQCCCHATIIGEIDNIGGLVGVAESGSVMRDCHANVNVQMLRNEAAQDTYTGGLVGWAEGTIENCYAILSEDTDTKRVAPFLGYLQEGQADVSGGSVKNCYYNATESSNEPYDKDATPKTLEDLRQQETFAGWNFEKVWKINSEEYHGFPSLQCVDD